MLTSQNFRDTIIFKDVALLEKQIFYTSLGDAYISEFPEMLLFSQIQPFFKDANIFGFMVMLKGV